jgi:NAD(P)-dependent dehydrogenase (short-subunit alcohol dehydrogenase family)
MTQDFSSQKIALITGANKGLGFETARQLGKKGVTVLLGSRERDSGIKVNAVCPGYAATDLNQFQGIKTPQEAVKVIVHYALLADDGPTGGFFNEEAPLPW